MTKENITEKELNEWVSHEDTVALYNKSHKVFELEFGSKYNTGDSRYNYIVRNYMNGNVGRTFREVLEGTFIKGERNMRKRTLYNLNNGLDDYIKQYNHGTIKKSGLSFKKNTSMNCIYKDDPRYIKLRDCLVQWKDEYKKSFEELLVAVNKSAKSQEREDIPTLRSKFVIDKIYKNNLNEGIDILSYNPLANFFDLEIIDTDRKKEIQEVGPKYSNMDKKSIIEAAQKAKEFEKEFGVSLDSIAKLYGLDSKELQTLLDDFNLEAKDNIEVSTYLVEFLQKPLEQLEDDLLKNLVEIKLSEDEDGKVIKLVDCTSAGMKALGNIVQKVEKLNWKSEDFGFNLDRQLKILYSNSGFMTENVFKTFVKKVGYDNVVREKERIINEEQISAVLDESPTLVIEPTENKKVLTSRKDAQQIEKLEHQIEKLKLEKKNLQKQVEDFKITVKNLRNEKKSLNDANKVLNRDLKKANKESSKMFDELVKIDAKLKKLREGIDI